MRSLVELINENLIYEVREKVYSKDVSGVTEFCNDVLSGDNWKVNKDLSVDIDKASGSGYDMSFIFPNNVTKIPDFIKFRGRDVSISLTTSGPYNKNLEEFNLNFDGTLSTVTVNNVPKLKEISINDVQIESIFIDKCAKLETIDLSGSEVTDAACARKNKSLKTYKAPDLGNKVNIYNIDNPGYTDELYIMDGVRYKRDEKGKLIKI